MRGTGQRRKRRCNPRRFIPAHAGNRRPDRPWPRPHPVHPRACGEQVDAVLRILAHAGSSPRMRGTGSAQSFRLHAKRFIPAHAGNSIGKPTRGGTTTVHPRACGEQPDTPDIDRRGPGSSPRMRGTGISGLLGLWTPRFIPAHAGNSRGAGSAPRNEAVHPRACGEQIVLCAMVAERSGSSPRMRGTGEHPYQHGGAGRFIPAHAGNRSPSPLPGNGATVHPRACGEQLVVIGMGHSISRFIPAHAGNSDPAAAVLPSPPVHPRACGEQGSDQMPPSIPIGSSPRMRGTDQHPSECQSR